MDDRVATVSALLREAGDAHHTVFRITDGADDDWATWYSDWLTTLSELPDVLGVKPVRSELTYLLVKLDAEYSAEPRPEPWQDHYGREIVRHFAGTPEA